MEQLAQVSLEIDKKLLPQPVPSTMYLYALDMDHLLLTEKEEEVVEGKALAKTTVETIDEGNNYVIRIPKRIFDFYHLDENDYTIMVSEKEPKNIVIAV